MFFSSLAPRLTKDEYVAATFGAIAAFAALYFVVLVTSCVVCFRQRRPITNVEDSRVFAIDTEVR